MTNLGPEQQPLPLSAHQVRPPQASSQKQLLQTATLGSSLINQQPRLTGSRQ